MTFAAAVMAAAVLSCSGSKTASGDPLADVAGLGRCTTESEAEQFYSSGTLKYARRLSEKYSGSDVLLGLDSGLFRQGMQYELIKADVTGRRCRVEFIVTSHPDLNFIGMNIKMTLEQENGKWKIDRSGELKSQK